MLRKATDSVVIRPRLSAPVRLAVVLVAIAVVAGASLAGYWGGRTVLHERLSSTSREIDALEEKLRQSRELRRNLEARFDAARKELENDFATAREKLEAEVEAARSRAKDARRRLEETQSSLTRVTRQLQIDQTAYRELRKELEASNRQITELGSELKFYRSIISPADGRSGVRIQEFELEPTGTADEYRYRLILIQALEHDEAVTGTVRFEISGTEEGASRVIESPGEAQGPISAEFKYFQNFVGTFKFSAGFMPAEVKVIFEADDSTVVQRTYPWPDRDTQQNA